MSFLSQVDQQGENQGQFRAENRGDLEPVSHQHKNLIERKRVKRTTIMEQSIAYKRI